MSFMNSMKKKAGEMVSQIMEEDGGPDGEPLRREVDRIEASLQSQSKELKSFVTGMNSMLGAALSAAELYRDEGGDGKLAVAMCDAEHALAKDMVKVLATWLNTEVQRPTIQALERTKTARAELSERARANSDLMSAEKRMVGPAQLNELREKLQSCDMHVRQSLEELGQQAQELAGRCAGGIVSCQRIMVHELGRLELRGKPEQTTLASLNQSAPPGWEDYLSAAGGTTGPHSPRRAGSEPPARGREDDDRHRIEQEQARQRAEAEAEAERERQRRRQQEHDQERRRREEEADAARKQAEQPPTGGDIFGMDVSPATSPPPVVHQRTNSGGAGLDNFFGASSGDVSAPQVSPAAAAPGSSGDLFGSPAPAPPPPADDFAAFGDFAPAPTPAAPSDDFGDFGAAPTPAPAATLDDDFFGFSSGAPAPPPATGGGGKPSGNLFSPPQAAAAPGNGGLDDLFGFAEPAPAPGVARGGGGGSRQQPPTDSDSAAISAMRQREAAHDALEAEKMMFAHEVEADVVKWGGPDYDPKNIRALLAGFHTIWKDERWQPCGIQELLTPANVKKKYRRAIVLVHPDKQKGKPAAQVMLAERVFEKLKAEWAKIQDEVGDTAAPVTQEASGKVEASWGVDNSSEVKGD